MPERCAPSFDNVMTLPKELLTERVCSLSVDRLAEASRALAIAAGC